MISFGEIQHVIKILSHRIVVAFPIAFNEYILGKIEQPADDWHEFDFRFGDHFDPLLWHQIK